MDPNQTIILAIIILSGIIVVFTVYFLIIFIHNKKSEKKIDTIFNPQNLIEEDSLMNVMDEKKNVEFTTKTKIENNNFLSENVDAKMVTSSVRKQDQQINPFGVDMTKHTLDKAPIIEDDEDRSQNKFFK